MRDAETPARTDLSWRTVTGGVVPARRMNDSTWQVGIYVVDHAELAKAHHALSVLLAEADR